METRQGVAGLKGVGLKEANMTGILFAMVLMVQSPAQTVDTHVGAAIAAAGQEHTALFALCTPPAPPANQPAQPAAQPQGPPDRSTWYADPAKVFDNLYFVGMKEHGAWAVTTSEGIIVIDPVFDYSVEEAVVNGLTKLGLNPRNIKYVIVSHGHSDHVGGARLLQDRFGAQVVMSAPDWDLVERDRGSWPKPKRDIVATDGQRIALGDTALTLYLTPGHTLGTISTVIPVYDGGRRHTAVLWGGTAFNWLRNRAAYITPERPDKFWFENYSNSARRFHEIAGRTGADVLLSNHTSYDRSAAKLPALRQRKSGDPHPYVIGTESVQRFATVADECAKAGALRLEIR
jgi:metallo-beta-lactamase class B